MDLQLAGKAALVTGSSRGLGLASALALAGEGCRVCICARGEEQLARAADALQQRAGADGRVLAVRGDLTSADDIAMIVRRTAETFGRLDVLVNNVGRAGGGGLLEATDEDWRSAFDDTLYPAIRASRLAVPHMRRAGGGAIIMIASIWGRESGGRMTYNAVKAAEISLAKALAQQLAGDDIRVNSVAPGSISFPGGSWHRRQQEDPDRCFHYRGRLSRTDQRELAAVALAGSPAEDTGRMIAAVPRSTTAGRRRGAHR